MKKFAAQDLKNIYRPHKKSSGEDNGQITIIGGSKLFHGPPFLAIRAASRIVDMVFFASPEEPLRDVAANLKSSIQSFIWVPFDEVEDYIKKSDAVLIGPGFMRASTEKNNHHEERDGDYALSREVTKNLLDKFPDKKWVIDAGSLQTMEPEWIPKNAILTPNRKEYAILFGNAAPIEVSKQYNCAIILKGPITHVYVNGASFEVHGGNPGMTKGGTGDTMAGLTVAIYAKNDTSLSAGASSYIIKMAGDELYKKKGPYYNADDLSEAVPEVFFKLTNGQTN